MVALAGTLLVPPLAAQAQQVGKVYRIGFLRASPLPKDLAEAFQQGLRELGYVVECSPFRLLTLGT